MNIADEIKGIGSSYQEIIADYRVLLGQSQETNKMLIREIEDLSEHRGVLLDFVCEWLERQGSDQNHMTEKARSAIERVIGEKIKVKK